MKISTLLVFLLAFQFGVSQVTLKADGPGNTYSLITSVLAPGYSPIETPDCGHTVFGDHIDEVFDTDLNANVFRFFIHTASDNDRCKAFDRQRNEIKSYDKSPANLLGVAGEKVVYKWKFKLNTGFQSSPSFTHIHQLKSVGGLLASMPMYTLTTRKSSPDRLELRYAVTDKQVTLARTDLAPLIGTWLEVTETIKYGTNGTYAITIKKVSDATTLFWYSSNSIINWRSGASFVRPKWGIYRSLNSKNDLRDEEVLFADFSVEEVDLLGVENIKKKDNSVLIYQNSENKILHIKTQKQVNLIQVFSIDGRKILHKKVTLGTNFEFDTSTFNNGIYIVQVTGEAVFSSKLLLIN